jgi:hypothetical protein
MRATSYSEHAALREHLEAVAERVVAEAIARDTSEAEEIRGELTTGAGQASRSDGSGGAAEQWIEFNEWFSL